MHDHSPGVAPSRRRPPARRPLLWLSAFCLALLCPVSPAASQADPQLQVTIIAVTEFDDQALRNPVLASAIAEAAKQLETFFVDKYHVVPRVFSQRDETTSDALRTWLFQDLRRNSQPSIHLVFFLSHGVGEQLTANTPFKTQLFLATSDTPNDHYAGRALTGDDLIVGFEHIPAGSSAFLFLDTCGSGSIANSGIAERLHSDGQNATHFMILASSTADESAFRARFTRALVDIWQHPEAPPHDCHYGEAHIENYINSRMQALDRLDPRFPQLVSMAYPFTGEFCIESFGTDTALALIANPTQEVLKVVLRPEAEQADAISATVKANSITPFVLRRLTYTAVVEPAFTSSPRPPTSFVLDLANDYVQYRSLDPTPVVANALVQQLAPAVAAEFGAPPPKVAELRARAQQELQAANLRLAQDDAELNKNLAEQKTRLAGVSQEQQAKESDLRGAVTAVAAARRALDNGAGVMAGVRIDDSAAQHAFSQASDRLARAQSAASAAASCLANETHTLSMLQDKTGVLTAQRVALATALQAPTTLNPSEGQARARSALLRALQGIFPAQDTLRGLTITVPSAATSRQLGALARVLADTKASMLIEVEVSVYGNRHRQDQSSATRRAASLGRALARSAPSLASSIVVRGFPGLPSASNAGGSTARRIIVSGDFLGSARSDTP